MKKLNFNTTEEFEQLFDKKNEAVTDAIVQSIEQAIMERKSTAKVFSITFADYDMCYEISLPKAEWIASLDSCLNYYHEYNCVDKAIDTWKLREAAKTL